jgi:hypothetical protein
LLSAPKNNGGQNRIYPPITFITSNSIFRVRSLFIIIHIAYDRQTIKECIKQGQNPIYCRFQHISLVLKLKKNEVRTLFIIIHNAYSR